MAVHLNLRGRRHKRGARNAPWLETSPCCTWYPDGLVSLYRTTREVLVTWIAAAAAAMRSAVAKQVPISRGKGAGACTHSKVHSCDADAGRVIKYTSRHCNMSQCVGQKSVVGQNHFPIIFQSRRPLRNVGLNHFPVLSHNDYFGSHPDAMTPRDLAFFIEPFSSSENGKYRPTHSRPGAGAARSQANRTLSKTTSCAAGRNHRTPALTPVQTPFLSTFRLRRESPLVVLHRYF